MSKKWWLVLAASGVLALGGAALGVVLPPQAQAFYIQNHERITRDALTPVGVDTTAMLQILVGLKDGRIAAIGVAHLVAEVHELAASERNVEPLAEAGFEVIAPDLRGFGDSPLAPDDRYDVAAHSSDMAELVRGLDLQRFPLFLTALVVPFVRADRRRGPHLPRRGPRRPSPPSPTRASSPPGRRWPRGAPRAAAAGQ